MKCRSCSWPESNVVDSRPAKGEAQVRRRRECPRCHRRWTTFEREERGTSTFAETPVIVPVTTTNGAHGPPQIDANPPTNSVGGIGGALSSGSNSLQISDPNPQSSELSEPRARARTKPQAKGQHAELIAEFVEQWEGFYGEKYPFVAKDGVQLSAMVKANPHLAAAWSGMVGRYLESAKFWAEKRHPLWGLATNPVEFAGEANGVASLSRATVQTGANLSRFVARGTK